MHETSQPAGIAQRSSVLHPKDPGPRAVLRLCRRSRIAADRHAPPRLRTAQPVRSQADLGHVPRPATTTARLNRSSARSSGARPSRWTSWGTSSSSRSWTWSGCTTYWTDWSVLRASTSIRRGASGCSQRVATGNIQTPNPFRTVSALPISCNRGNILLHDGDVP
jgi:hypothetical protein